MADRYFVDSPLAGSRAVLTDAEAHHLGHVLRARPGDEVSLFDGSGAEFLARVVRVGRAEIELEVVERKEVDRELPLSVTLGVALPKGDRQRWLVEKAVELGLERLVPLATQRGVAEATPSALNRLRRTAIEAAKQCGRNRLLVIDEPRPLAEFLQAAPASALRLLAHPDGNALAPALAATDMPPAVWLAVGPEGGFSDDEADQSSNSGWQAVSLGPRILRVETATLALLAAVGARAESLR